MGTDNKYLADELTEAQKRSQRLYLRGKGINPDSPIQLSLIIPSFSVSKRMQPNDTIRSALFTARSDKVERET